MKQDDVKRHMLVHETGCDTRKKLNELGLKEPPGTTVTVTPRTSITIRIPENLEGDERQAFIEQKVNKFILKMKGKVL